MRRCLAVLASLLAVAPALAGARGSWLRTVRPGEPPTLLPPTSALFAVLKADPLEMRSVVRVVDSDLTDSAQIITAVGARAVVYERGLNDGMRWQLIAGGAGYGRYDLAHSLDQITEDWRFGLIAATRYGPWSYAASLLHLSSHLGDELIARTGRARIEYVLEEVGFTTSYDSTDHLRAYWGAHYAVRQTFGDAPMRVQAGAEYWLLPRLVPGGLGPYAALDLQARGEAGWKPAASAVIGWAFPGWVRDRTLDVQIVGGAGATTARQFVGEEETYVGLAVAADL